MVNAFDSWEVAMEELKNDPCFGKINPSDVIPLVEDIRRAGTKKAEEVWEKYSGVGIRSIIEKSGLTIDSQSKDNVVGEMRYFSEFYPAKKRIVLYNGSIQIWADKNGFTLEEACTILLAHEFFHHLETSELGLFSKRYLVPMIKIGNWEVGKTGIRALSEIGAYAFSGKIFELSGGESNHESCV